LQTLLGDFTKEQSKFVTEQKEREKKTEAAVPPWVGYNEEESMKSQILALSQVTSVFFLFCGHCLILLFFSQCFGQ